MLQIFCRFRLLSFTPCPVSGSFCFPATAGVPSGRGAKRAAGDYLIKLMVNMLTEEAHE